MQTINHIPEKFQDIREFKIVTDCYDKENSCLTAITEDLYNDQFILTTKKALQRYENMLKIVPEKNDSINSRRAEVLAIYNRKLPYTLYTLKRFICSIVNKEDFTLNINYNLHVLELTLLNQELKILQSLKQIIEEMIPMNIIFLTIGKYINKALLQIETDTIFTMNTEFYPRDNTEYLTLNGTWSLNDKYTINGYKSDKPVDFYPVGMQLSTFIKNNVGLVSLQTYCTDLKTETSSKVCYQIKSDCNINTKEDTSIAIHTFVSKDIKNIAKQTYYTDLKVDLASSSENSIKTEYKVKAERENIVLIRSSSNVTSKVTSNVTVAKNVWKLDGSYRLDGSRIIPEKSEDYML